VSTDLFYDPDVSRARAWKEAGALAVEMEAAALATVAGQHGIRFGCVLAVSDVLGDERSRIDADALDAAGERLGLAGADVLRESGL
jgi:nucleoside phosphorylase